MNRIQSLLARIDRREDLNDIRLEIIDLIGAHIEQNAASLENWEIAHFINALGSLAMNISSSNQPSYAGLHLCLFDVEKALNVRTIDSADYDAIGQMRKAVSRIMLTQSIATIRQRITCLENT